MLIRRFLHHIKNTIPHIPKCAVDGFLVAALPFLLLTNEYIETWASKIRSFFNPNHHEAAKAPLSDVFLSQVVDFRLAVLFCIVFSTAPLILYPISFLMQDKRWDRRKIRVRLTSNTFTNGLKIRLAMTQRQLEITALWVLRKLALSLRYVVLTLNHTFVGFLQIIGGVYMFQLIKQFELIHIAGSSNQSTNLVVWFIAFVSLAAWAKSLTLSNEKVKDHKFKSLRNQER